MSLPPIWIADFNKNFSFEVESLHKIEPIWDPCTSCMDGYCCKHEVIPVTRLEWTSLIKYKKATYSKDDQELFDNNIRKNSHGCPFLFGCSCSVYPVRPWACRLFPYTISSHRKAYQGEFLAPYCPGLAKRFGMVIGKPMMFSPKIIERSGSNHLVKIEIKSNLRFWVIDITKFFIAWENNMPKNANGSLIGNHMHQWTKMIKNGRMCDPPSIKPPYGKTF